METKILLRNHTKIEFDLRERERERERVVCGWSTENEIGAFICAL